MKNKETAPVAQCQPYLLEYIKLGAKNNPVEVKKLQEFLKDKEEFKEISISGIYDEKTYNYVKQFQSDYMKDVLIPWNLSTPTGYVFETTKKKINELYCSCEKYLKEYIKFGAQNNPSEVEKLQSFLKDYEGYGDISITGTYDEQTYAAVKEFQTKYINDVLAPWDHSTPTGYVYKTTKQKINELYCQYIKGI
ncbi:peptidoglycan-binding protein [Patescibacteria group bacterium]|nr:peptidoglycan-binding protein [Patescibacteria group bacterium]MBU4601287.1 peptidoglycan-binding protein [Patescibacteria group bacterium]MCG2698394.1 peptidoglycan-binding protein [Candidatus Parcubacteria bacterium]